MAAIPKPKYRKQKKAKNNPAPSGYERCAVCGQLRVCETHEVYGGTNRQNSIKMKYQVKLCKLCHIKVTGNEEEVEWHQTRWRRNFQLQQIKQWMLEGMSRQKAEEEWLSLIGRSYLEEETECCR